MELDQQAISASASIAAAHRAGQELVDNDNQSIAEQLSEPSSSSLSINQQKHQPQSTPLIVKWKSKERNFSQDQLSNFFSPFGEIDMVQVVKNGRAFVFFKRSQSAVSFTCVPRMLIFFHYFNFLNSGYGNTIMFSDA